MTEQRRIKTKTFFNRCLNRLRVSGSKIPALMTKHGYIEFLKQHRHQIITDTPVPDSRRETAMIQYESDMYDVMLETLKNEAEVFEKPAVGAELSAMKRLLEELESFKSKITVEEPHYDHEKFDGWGGSGIVISSNPSDLKMQDFGDKVILAVNPAPIVWLMHTLKDLCDEYLDYLNKQKFFHGIAQLAENRLDDCDEMSSYGETQFFSEGIQFAKDKVEDHVRYLSDLLEDFDSFIAKKGKYDPNNVF
jgi:hypothetical protein